MGGGYSSTASGVGATVPGGGSNTAAGEYSFAAGYRAKANHNGTFVWGDETTANVTSTDANQFIVRASGGVWFGTSSSPSWPGGSFLATSTGAYLSTGGTWTDNSDRNLKEHFAAVDGQPLLARLADVPILTWNYKAEETSVRHMGPTAQDFYAAFGLGQDDKHIGALDANGVALAAIQALYKLSQDKDKEITQLRQQVDELRARLARLE